VKKRKLTESEDCGNSSGESGTTNWMEWSDENSLPEEKIREEEKRGKGKLEVHTVAT